VYVCDDYHDTLLSSKNMDITHSSIHDLAVFVIFAVPIFCRNKLAGLRGVGVSLYTAQILGFTLLGMDW
jgi:hypothetical protein